MIFDQLVNAIEKQREGRDLLLDELTDAIESAEISEADADEIVNKVEALVSLKADSSEQESFFNMLATLYFRGRSSSLIEDVVEKRIASVDVGSLVHCIEIICASARPHRDRVLNELLDHPSPVIRNLVSECISSRLLK